MESYENTNLFLNIFKGVGFSVIFTIVSLFIFSLLLVYTDIDESLMQPVVIVITGVSILLGSFIGNRKSRKNGILKGGAIGLIYIICIYLISSAINGGNFSLNIQSIIMMSVGIVGGIIGGIIGVNV